ncbi:MAG: hypothetical protein ABW318_02400 [Vicinamibacterales bacterium]
MRILVRNVLLVALLSGVLFLLLEGGVRLWAPQQTWMEMLSGESLAVKDSVLGHRQRPGAVGVDHAIEFTALYAINNGNRVVAEYFADQLDLVVQAWRDTAPIH